MIEPYDNEWNQYFSSIGFSRKHMLSVDGADSVGSHSDADTPTSTIVEAEPVPIASETVESNAEVDFTSQPQEEVCHWLLFASRPFRIFFNLFMVLHAISGT